MPPSEAQAGLLTSLASLAARGVDMLHTRLQLLALELEVEARHHAAVLGLLLAAAACLAFALALATVALVLACEERHRLTVLLALAGFYALLGSGTALIGMKKMRSKTPALTSTLAQLREDGRELGGAP